MKGEPIETLLSTHDCLCLHRGHMVKHSEWVCVEKVFHLYLNEKAIGNIVASPFQLKELGAGFVISEGLAEYVENVVVDGDQVKVFAGRTDKPKEIVTG